MAEQTLHPVFLQPLDSTARVWRYLDLPKFIDLLHKRTLTLSRIDKFLDPFEGSIPFHTLQELERRLNLHGINQQSREQGFQIRKSMRTRTYANCWNLSESESNALWRLYCGDSQGVAICTTYAALQDSLIPYPNFYTGLVRYIDFDKESYPEDEINVYHLAMHKQTAFAHENEVRVVWIDNSATRFARPGETEEERAPIKSLNWNIEKVIQSVYVHPCASEWYAEVVRSVIEKFTPDWKQQVQWSALKRPPQY